MTALWGHTLQPVLGKFEIATFLERLAFLQLHGTGRELAQCLTLPVAYYLPDRTLVFSDRDKIAQRFDTHRAYLTICRVTRIEARDLVVHDATPNRAFVALSWHYLNAQGETLRRSEVQYVLCRAPEEDGIRIEMADYAVVAFPQFLQTALSGGRA